MCQFVNIINCHYRFSVFLPEVNYKIIIYTDMVHFVELLKYLWTFPIVYIFTSHTHIHKMIQRLLPSSQCGFSSMSFLHFSSLRMLFILNILPIFLNSYDNPFMYGMITTHIGFNSLFFCVSVHVCVGTKY